MATGQEDHVPHSSWVAHNILEALKNKKKIMINNKKSWRNKHTLFRSLGRV